MSKIIPLSPKKYIETKARTLPIYKCYVNEGWKTVGLANVFVLRKHINGNITMGIFLADVFCLGVKEVTYFFNYTQLEIDKILKRVNKIGNIEIDYNLAHNIIYAAHDFAMEYDIHPHKDFAIAKYILEEDDDNIPLIDIKVGGQNGYPFLVVKNPNQHKDALEKLKKNAGEGYYDYLCEIY